MFVFPLRGAGTGADVVRKQRGEAREATVEQGGAGGVGERVGGAGERVRVRWGGAGLVLDGCWTGRVGETGGGCMHEADAFRGCEMSALHVRRERVVRGRGGGAQASPVVCAGHWGGDAGGESAAARMVR
jgi:hypothetical protein